MRKLKKTEKTEGNPKRLIFLVATKLVKRCHRTAGFLFVLTRSGTTMRIVARVTVDICS